MAAPQNAPRLNNDAPVHSSNQSRRNNLKVSSFGKLPTGPCNYTNLSIGATARCGCQGFWDRTKYADNRSDGGKTHRNHDICMCEHHACYHEFQGSREVPAPQIILDSSSQESSTKPRSREESLPSTYHESPQARKRIPLEQRHDALPQLQENVEVQWDDIILTQVEQLGMDSGNIHEGGSGLRQSHSGRPSSRPGLPPIPSQCLLPPDISSGGVEGDSQSMQSFGDLVFNKSNMTDRGQGARLEVESFNQSATEVVTPSPQGSPDLGTTSKFVTTIQTIVNKTTIDEASEGHNATPRSKQLAEAASARLNTGLVAIRQPPAPDTTSFDIFDAEGAKTPLRQVLPHLQALHRQLNTHPTLQDKLKNHSQRLDLLENASYSNAGFEEVHEKFDLFEDRIVEVETKVEELEKTQAALNDTGSVDSHRRVLQQLHDANSSMNSQTSSAMISAAIGRVELMSRIETLETQVSSLHASILPSSSNPWEMEVVFLPFGSNLRGIWTPLNQFPSQRSRRSSMEFDDWTQTQFSTITKTQPNTANENTSWEDLNDMSHDINDWLVARACGPGSKVEERLRSRGLVKKVAIKGSDARDVQAAMLIAFGTLPKILAIPSPPKNSLAEVPNHLQSYHGLYASWVPLRKLHKDSRLRFLDPAEMVTPALWTAIFLSSSVAMRATGAKRLYVTQRDSYIQQGGDHVEWSWQRLRELPRVYPDSQSPNTGFPGSTEVREADAREVCWEWDERLDLPQSANSSFVSHHSSLSIRGPPQEDERTRSSKSVRSSSNPPSPIPSTTPTSIVAGRAVSPLMERQIPRPLHTRTISMPSMLHLHLPSSSQGPGKRRIASFDQEPREHTSPPPLQVLSAKRQRMSRSPSRPRDTPRWSVGPPSPYFVEEPMDQKRGITPLAYATPFSNVPYNEWRARSVDTPGLGIDMDGGVAGDEEGGGSTTDEVELDHDQEDFSADEDFEHDHDNHDITHEYQQQPQYQIRPDDDIWEGVEEDTGDDDNSGMEHRALSTDENDENENPEIDNEDADDAMSDNSSRPSEYPSTEPSALYGGNRGAFLIHIDDDEEDEVA